MHSQKEQYLINQLATARDALQDVVTVLGPRFPKGLTCEAERHEDNHRAGCQGCQHEWSTALETARVGLFNSTIKNSNND